LLDLLLALDHQYRVRSNGNILIFVGQVGNVQATYLVEIVPEASNRTNPIHYYPPSIAVPGGTTVTWFNNDPEQPPTVTSGMPGASDSGIIFNSGITPATINSFFQYTFNKAGD
jgi:plastocyanin